MAGPPLTFDPIAEARRQWSARWPESADVMAAATSIMRAQQIVLAAVDDALRPFELTFARYEALVLLRFTRHGELPLGKMGLRLMIHPTSVTNIVDRLGDQGLVEKRYHPHDGRIRLARITERGRTVVEQATQAVIGSQFGLSALGPDDLEQLVTTVRGLRLAVGDFHDPEPDQVAPVAPAGPR